MVEEAMKIEDWLGLYKKSIHNLHASEWSLRRSKKLRAVTSANAALTLSGDGYPSLSLRFFLFFQKVMEFD